MRKTFYTNFEYKYKEHHYAIFRFVTNFSDLIYVLHLTYYINTVAT